MTRSARVVFGLSVMGLMGWFTACGDPSGIKDGDGGEEPVPEETISEPIAGPAPSFGGAGRDARILSSTVAAAGPGEEVAYITLPPLTRPTADIAVIRNPAHEGSITVAMRGGGFDPVPLVASPGDVVDVQLFRSGGVNVGALSMLVPSRKAPRVVRANPPRGMRDVPMNKHIVVVFSEPIDPTSLSTSTFTVRRGNSTVAGSVRLIDGSGLTAAFVPNAPLAAGVQYTVGVNGVRDIQGDALTGTYSQQFTTGSSTTGPPAAIRMSVDTVRLGARTYQLSATVEDVAGNILADRTIVWQSFNPAVASVSQTGLVTALMEGNTDVYARVGDLASYTNVIVTSPGPIATLTVEPPTASVIAEDTIVLESVLLDA
jgi:hypothetical protein